jgi:hypothetical protein
VIQAISAKGIGLPVRGYTKEGAVETVEFVGVAA